MRGFESCFPCSILVNKKNKIFSFKDRNRTFSNFVKKKKNFSLVNKKNKIFLWKFKNLSFKYNNNKLLKNKQYTLLNNKNNNFFLKNFNYKFSYKKNLNSFYLKFFYLKKKKNLNKLFFNSFFTKFLQFFFYNCYFFNLKKKLLNLILIENFFLFSSYFFFLINNKIVNTFIYNAYFLFLKKIKNKKIKIYYLNFLFFNNSFNFFRSITVKNKNSKIVLFNKFPLTSLTGENTNKKNFKKVFFNFFNLKLPINNFFSKRNFKKFYYKIKINLTPIYFNNGLRATWTKLYTYNTLKKKIKKRKQIDFFILSHIDYLNDSVIRVTRRSINYNLKNLFYFKKIWLLIKFFFNNIFSFFLNSSNRISNTWFFYFKYYFNLASLPVMSFVYQWNLKKIKNYAKNTQLFFNLYLKNFSLLLLKKKKTNFFLNKNKIQIYNFFLKKNNFYTFFNTKNKTFILNKKYSSEFFTNYLFNSTNTEKLFFFFFKPLYIKIYLIYAINQLCTFPIEIIAKKLQYLFNKKFFFSKHKNSTTTNIFYEKNFLFFIKKSAIKSFSFYKLSLITYSWHYLLLIKFLEFFFHKKIYFKTYSLLSTDLEISENTRCLMWSNRLNSFKRSFGAKLFVVESLKIIYTALKYKDLYFLSNWLLKFFYKISFWKYKMIFRYLYYVLRYLFQPYLREIGVKGIKFQLKGKISVAGNARTRTIRNRIGNLSHATFKNKIISELNLINTFTGVIGFKTWLSF